MASRPQLAMNDIKTAFLPPLSRPSCFPPKDPADDHDPFVVEVCQLVSNCSMIPRQWLGVDGPASPARYDADLVALLTSMKNARLIGNQSNGAYYTYYPFEDRVKQAEVELCAALDRAGIDMDKESNSMVRHPLLYHIVDASADQADRHNAASIESLVTDYERVFLVCLVQSAFPFPKLEAVAVCPRRKDAMSGSCAPWYVHFMHQVYQRVQRNIRRFYYINDTKNPYKVPFRPRKYLVEAYWQEREHKQQEVTNRGSKESGDLGGRDETMNEYVPESRTAYSDVQKDATYSPTYRPVTPYSPTYSPTYEPMALND